MLADDTLPDLPSTAMRADAAYLIIRVCVSADKKYRYRGELLRFDSGDNFHPTGEKRAVVFILLALDSYNIAFRQHG